MLSQAGKSVCGGRRLVMLYLSTNHAAIRKGGVVAVMCTRFRYECPADECTDQVVLCFYIIRVGSDSEWKCKVVDD